MRQFVATKSQKNSSTRLLAMQMSQLEENMPQELGLSKRSKLSNMQLASLVTNREAHLEVKFSTRDGVW